MVDMHDFSYSLPASVPAGKQVWKVTSPGRRDPPPPRGWPDAVRPMRLPGDHLPEESGCAWSMTAPHGRSGGEAEAMAIGYQALLTRLTQWARTQEDIRLALVVGSRARVDHPADEYSDLDVVLVTTLPQRYLSTADWVADLGSVWLTFVEPTAQGGLEERRVLFEGGLDVDFTVMPYHLARAMAEGGLPRQLAAVVRRGVRVLVDKEGIGERLLASPAPAPTPRPPTAAEFSEVVSDFWYHAVWTAKKLRRGELWVAKACCDGYMKRLLLRMIEWHARATRGWDLDTWHDGRFLERWADSRVPEALRAAFGRYDPDDLGRALVATADLFRWLAMETATSLGYPYPALADSRAMQTVATLLRNSPQPPSSPSQPASDDPSRSPSAWHPDQDGQRTGEQ